MRAVVEPVLDQHELYHQRSHYIEGAVALSALLLTQHRVGYIALAVLIGVQGIHAGLAPVEVRRLEDYSFKLPENWHLCSRKKVQRGKFAINCCLAGALVAAPFSIGPSMLAITVGMRIWGDVRFYRSIKKRMIRVLKLHEINKDEVKAADLHRKLRKIKAKALTPKAWSKLKTLPKLHKLTVDTLHENLKLPQLNVLTTIVLSNPTEGWQNALVDCSWIERIIIKGKVKPEDVQMILQGKHLRLRVIEFKYSAGMHTICGGSYHWVPPKKKDRAKIKVSMR